MREFILRSLKGKTLDINLNNLIEGRMDLVCRCISNALFVSNNVRRDVIIHIVLEGSGDPPRTVSFFGETIKKLGLDEKSIAIILKNALNVGKGLKLSEEKNVQEGVKIAKKSFEALIKERKNIYYLHNEGIDIRKVNFPKDVVFVFGDYIGMPRKTEGLLDRLSAKRISLGNKIYFASHCVTIVNYELDRKI
ncbi:MAG TPA: tRNA (pseudouridine(54)-N(1))-methyltransferase TrmY [Candidatus Nanoarchaeia archaeon]|nr:tRNA (pseudouridine(54)-N(1))-methyltransferase TrmY [Candidatus Nanoarchaeia archaeon]